MKSDMSKFEEQLEDCLKCATTNPAPSPFNNQSIFTVWMVVIYNDGHKPRTPTVP